MNTTLDIRTVPVDKLNPAPYNPRKDLKPGDKEYEKIKRSMDTFSYVDPIVWNEVTGYIVGGHQRFKVLVAEGATEIDVSVVHIENPQDEKALNVALNKAAGAWEPVALADLLKDLQESGYVMDVTGFDAPEIEELYASVFKKEAKEDNFDVEEALNRPTFSKYGDIWHLGKHRVICGDSTMQMTYDLLLDGEKVNLVLTDPPYNVDVEESAGKIMNDNMADEEFYNFLLSAYKCMHDSLAQDGSIYVFHADTEGLNFRKAFKDAGFKLSGCCIWKKNALVLGRSPYQWQHEPCLFGWRTDGTHQWYSDRKQTTIWEYDRPKSSKDHPTMKPVGLMAYPIRNSTMTNGIVLDPFLGSGSTLIACCETDRICRGIELDVRFVDVIVRRYIDYRYGKYDDVFVERNGESFAFTDVASLVDE